MEVQSNASSEDFFDKQAREKALANDPRFQLDTSDKNNNADSLQAEKMGIVSMLADISGKKQIIVSEQREKFSDPSKMRFDPSKENIDEQPIKKKPKLDESKTSSKQSKPVQDT